MISINIAGDNHLIRGWLDPVPKVTKTDSALLGRYHCPKDSIALI